MKIYIGTGVYRLVIIEGSIFVLSWLLENLTVSSEVRVGKNLKRGLVEKICNHTLCSMHIYCYE